MEKAGMEWRNRNSNIPNLSFLHQTGSFIHQWWFLSTAWCHFLAYTLGRVLAMWLLTQCGLGHEYHSSRSHWITGLHEPAYPAQPQYQWILLCWSNHTEVFIVQFLCRQWGAKPTTELGMYEEAYWSLWKDFKSLLIHIFQISKALGREF